MAEVQNIPTEIIKEVIVYKIYDSQRKAIKKYQENNHEKVLEWKRNYYERNKERLREKQREYDAKKRLEKKMINN
jgi:hypothetical protein